jgi:hypothetical protein
MYVAFALLADAANVALDGKLNILGVFDVVRAATFPTVLPRVHLVARLKAQVGDVGTHRVGLQVTGPGGGTLVSAEFEMAIHPLPAGVSEVDIPLVQMLDVPLERAGPHAVLLSIGGQVASQLPLAVHGGPAAPVAPPAFQPPASGTLVS